MVLYLNLSLNAMLQVLIRLMFIKALLRQVRFITSVFKAIIIEKAHLNCVLSIIMHLQILRLIALQVPCFVINLRFQ